MNRTQNVDKLQQQRRHKLDELRRMGIDPYGQRFDDTRPAGDIKSRFEKTESPDRVRCAGRIVLLRDIGKLIFITLRDSSGTIQLGLSKKILKDCWPMVKLLEMGDIIGAEGPVGRTKTGEITVWADSVTMLAKSLLPPPEKWHGLADTDLRFRRRYVDLWANPEVMERFRKRVEMLAAMRGFLQERSFLEVETPMMQAIPGGAAAKPFVTHHNALDIDLYLRIAPELFLKRLLVGGMEKVFEINRNFRNEGLSTRHNPEFTMLELYQAYGDYHIMMELTEELISRLVEDYCAAAELEFAGMTVDFSRPWRKAPYAELLKEYSGCAIEDIGALRKKAQQLGINEAEMDDAIVVEEVFEATVEENLINPTFVLDYPAALCPLTKQKADDPGVAERFELYIAKMEIANAYTELNDPDKQYENFLHQLRGREETMAVMDEDFITALKYGMPPAGGLGIGIDRLMMLLTGATTIRDVVLFPLLKPAGD